NPSGPTRWSRALVAAARRAIDPVFCGISGRTKTMCKFGSASCIALFSFSLFTAYCWRDSERIPVSPEIDVETSGVVGFEAVAEMVVGGAKEAGATIAVLDARVEDVVGADLQRGGIERLASVVVQHHHESAQLVVFERLDYVGRVLDRDRRVFVSDLQIVTAVGIALDAAAEEQGDSRVVDPLVVAVPVAVAPKRDLSRFDGIESRQRHRKLLLQFFHLHFSRLSRMIVTGPSLTLSTSIIAPNSPLSTLTSRLRTSERKCS